MTAITKTKKRKTNFLSALGHTVAMLILLALSALVLIPLIWTVCMALKPDGEIYNGHFFPTTLQWDNFYKAVTSIDFFRYLGNTMLIVVPNVIGII